MEAYGLYRMAAGCVFFLMMGLLTSPSLAHKHKPLLRDCREKDVCRTSLKYKDGTVADEGLICKCSADDDSDGDGNSLACPKDWTEGDGRTLTWQHYERAHWHVQYRFCTQAFSPQHICTANTLAAVVETDVKSWHPHVSKPRCVCRDGESYKLTGWVREGKMWRYYYYCEKPECPAPDDTMTDQSACAKIYIDPYRSSDMVNEMRFLCNCPREHMCNAKFDEKTDLKDIYSDEDGKYVIKTCELIINKKR